jgi:hypothetical protein
MTDMNPKFRSIMLSPTITCLPGVEMFRSSSDNARINQLMFRTDIAYFDLDEYKARCIAAGADEELLTQHIYEMSRFLVFHIDHPKG